MRQAILEIPVFTSDGDSIATSQSPSAGGQQALVLDGVLATSGVALLGGELPVDITSDDDDSDRVFVVIGYKNDGAEVIEAVRGPNTGTVRTTLTFAAVTSVLVDDDTAGAIEVGIDADADGVYSRWFPLDYVLTDFNVGISVEIPAGATAVAAIQYTQSDVMDPTLDGTQPRKKASIFELFRGPITAIDHATLTNLSASAGGVITSPVGAVRLEVTATDAPIRALIRQSGHGNG